jgi:hypothetical protein
VTSDRYGYAYVLKEIFAPFLQSMGINFGETLFQKDEARPYIRNAVCGLLNEYFDNRVMYNPFPGWIVYGWPWPPCSPDMNLCHYFYGTL